MLGTNFFYRIAPQLVAFLELDGFLLTACDAWFSVCRPAYCRLHGQGIGDYGLFITCTYYCSVKNNVLNADILAIPFAGPVGRSGSGYAAFGIKEIPCAKVWKLGWQSGVEA